MNPILTTTNSDVLAMTAYAGRLFTDLAPYVILAIGLPLAFWVIRKVIALVRVR